MMDHFILMADIKYSGSHNQDEVRKALQNLILIINKINKKYFITELDMVLPSEFQGITNSLQGSLEILFDIEECIIENNLDFKLKYVLYHDTIDTIQSKHSAYERLGFGLIDARDRLQLIKKTDSRFLIATSNEKNSLYLNNLFMIYEDYVDSWKKNDFEFVKAFLNNMNYKEVAELFNINISSGWRRERSLKMKQYYTIKEMILSGVD
ncbi:MAG: hypothetical protein K9H41_12060 [Bacteroidia bacterium]|nr:hypothetical protein [Bacteroidia bacterium]